MKQLLFRVTGITRKRRKKLQWQIDSSIASHVNIVSTQALAFLAVGGVSIYGLGTVLPEMTTILLESPNPLNTLGKTIVIPDKKKPIIATSILLIRDRSGSMLDKQTQLNDQVEKLKQGGIKVLDENQYAVSGLGVNTTSPDNLLGAIEKALQFRVNSQVDAIYAFSDFDIYDSPNWSSDEAGYQQLERLLSVNKIRLYLGTVANQPPMRLVTIARRSGGGLI